MTVVKQKHFFFLVDVIAIGIKSESIGWRRIGKLVETSLLSNLSLDWNHVHHDMTQLLDVFLRTRLIDILFETVLFNF